MSRKQPSISKNPIEMINDRLGDRPRKPGADRPRTLNIFRTPSSEMTAPASNAARANVSRRLPWRAKARYRNPPKPSTDPRKITAPARSNAGRFSAATELGGSVPARFDPSRKSHPPAANSGRLTRNRMNHGPAWPSSLLKAAVIIPKTATASQARAASNTAKPAQPYGPDTGGKRRDPAALIQVNLRFHGSPTPGV